MSGPGRTSFVNKQCFGHQLFRMPEYVQSGYRNRNAECDCKSNAPRNTGSEPCRHAHPNVASWPCSWAASCLSLGSSHYQETTVPGRVENKQLLSTCNRFFTRTPANCMTAMQQAVILFQGKPATERKGDCNLCIMSNRSFNTKGFIENLCRI